MFKIVIERKYGGKDLNGDQEKITYTYRHRQKYLAAEYKIISSYLKLYVYYSQLNVLRWNLVRLEYC